MAMASATNRFTAQLRAHERHSSQEITAAHSCLKHATTPIFAQIVKQLEQAQKGDRHMGLWWLYEQNRLQNVQDVVYHAVSQYAASSAVTINQGRRRALEIGAASAVAQLSKRLAVPHAPAPAHLRALADAPTVAFDMMVADTYKRVQDALLLAASLGITLAMLEHLLARAVDRLLPFVMGVDVTIEYDAFRDMLGTWYQANSDTVEAWQWATAEDERVCAFCESIHALATRSRRSDGNPSPMSL